MATSPLYERPMADEYAPYYERYVARVPVGPIPLQLKRQIEETVGLLDTVRADKVHYAYAAGKWTVKEVVGHIADTERVMAYRALRFARNDQTELAGFDEQKYTPEGKFGDRSLRDLLQELRTVRAATVALFEGIPSECLMRFGTANGQRVSVRALGYIIAGHELHHVAILKDSYRSIFA
jgi:hypothetical protein